MTTLSAEPTAHPQRIQRKRTKGWRMPEGAVYVGRPTKYGNPFEAYKCPCCGHWDVRDDNGVTYLINHEYTRRPERRADPRTWTTKAEAAAHAVWLYVADLTLWAGGRLAHDPDLRAAIESLRGRDLACWCPLVDPEGRPVPCHADALLDLANSCMTVDQLATLRRPPREIHDVWASKYREDDQ